MVYIQYSYTGLYIDLYIYFYIFSFIYSYICLYSYIYYVGVYSMVYIQYPYTSLYLGFFYTHTDIDLHYYPYLISEISTMIFISCKSVHILCRAIHYGVATISRILKIIGSFAIEPCKRDDILQKRPIMLRSLLTVAAPQGLYLVFLHRSISKILLHTHRYRSTLLSTIITYTHTHTTSSILIHTHRGIVCIHTDIECIYRCRSVQRYIQEYTRIYTLYRCRSVSLCDTPGILIHTQKWTYIYSVYILLYIQIQSVYIDVGLYLCVYKNTRSVCLRIVEYSYVHTRNVCLYSGVGLYVSFVHTVVQVHQCYRVAKTHRIP